MKTAKNTFPRAGTIRPPFSSVRVQGKRSPDIPPKRRNTIMKKMLAILMALLMAALLLPAYAEEGDVA